MVCSGRRAGLPAGQSVSMEAPAAQGTASPAQGTQGTGSPGLATRKLRKLPYSMHQRYSKHRVSSAWSCQTRQPYVGVVERIELSNSTTVRWSCRAYGVVELDNRTLELSGVWSCRTRQPYGVVERRRRDESQQDALLAACLAWCLYLPVVACQ